MAATTPTHHHWLDGDRLALGPMTSLLCCYRNIGHQLLILRCCGPEDFFLERVVFPFELVTFACPADTEVKIWHWDVAGPTLIDCCLAEAMACGEVLEAEVLEAEVLEDTVVGSAL